MKTANSLLDYSCCQWYPLFSKNALEAVILPLTKQLCQYLEHDAFILPLEATNNSASCHSEWSDGSAVENEDQQVLSMLSKTTVSILILYSVPTTDP